MAESGQLIFVLSGPEATIAKIKPYTKGVMGRALIELPNEEPGKALLLKITGNTFIFNMVEAVAQGLTMAEKTGLGTDYIYQFIEHMFPGPYVAYANRMLQGDYFKKEVSGYCDIGSQFS
jgi:3-hydroxyisobutyrate dehydrogenase-like beta-hydroxyacid dehydrogenase